MLRPDLQEPLLAALQVVQGLHELPPLGADLPKIRPRQGHTDGEAGGLPDVQTLLIGLGGTVQVTLPEEDVAQIECHDGHAVHVTELLLDLNAAPEVADGRRPVTALLARYPQVVEGLGLPHQVPHLLIESQAPLCTGDFLSTVAQMSVDGAQK